MPVSGCGAAVAAMDAENSLRSISDDKVSNMYSIGLLLLLAQAPAADPWALLQPLLGKWRGEVSGLPGKGTSEREYKTDLRGKVIVGRNRSVYEKETHEDFGVFSYDRQAKAFMLRQFHVEGFVNEYKLVRRSEDGREFEFLTERIENIPAGYRAREAYRFLGPDEFVETFSLAEPGKDFEVYSETRFRRVK
jgi:hypothetical protein